MMFTSITDCIDIDMPFEQAPALIGLKDASVAGLRIAMMQQTCGRYSLEEVLNTARMLRQASQHDSNTQAGPSREPARAPVAPMADSSDDDDDDAELPEIDWEDQFGSNAIAE